MSKYPSYVFVEIAKMQAALDRLNAKGYILDFVEDAHCICHVNNLKKEMKKPFRQIDTNAYVVNSLQNNRNNQP